MGLGRGWGCCRGWLGVDFRVGKGRGESDGADWGCGKSVLRLPVREGFGWRNVVGGFCLKSFGLLLHGLTVLCMSWRRDGIQLVDRNDRSIAVCSLVRDGG